MPVPIQARSIPEWNAQGREAALYNTGQLTALHSGQTDAVNLINDPRRAEMAEAVLAQVIHLNATGQGSAARKRFDPAHGLFAARMKDSRGLKFCAILGPDRFLVQQGATYEPNTTWLIEAGRIARAAPLHAFAWSRNRKHFLAVHPDGGLTVSPGYGLPPSETIPALRGTAFVPKGMPPALALRFETPDDTPAYSHIAISDDGETILLADEERGVMLLRKSPWGRKPTGIDPYTSRFIEEMQSGSDDVERYDPSLAMLHAALSPDGHFAALGVQNGCHHLMDLRGSGALESHAMMGNLSEYPHDACFSDDGQTVALNSCHLYHGCTFASDMATIRGLTTEAYETHPTQTIINEYLRVYASGWLPPAMTGAGSGAFLLAGDGVATAVTAKGKVIWELLFGGSAGGLDICPETGRILLASASGILHLLDPAAPQDPIITAGFNAPTERGRWIFWDSLAAPVIW